MERVRRRPCLRCSVPDRPRAAACGLEPAVTAPCARHRIKRKRTPQDLEGVLPGPAARLRSRNVQQRPHGSLRQFLRGFRRQSLPCRLPSHRLSPPGVVATVPAAPAPHWRSRQSSAPRWEFGLRASKPWPRPCSLPVGLHRRWGQTPPDLHLLNDRPPRRPGALPVRSPPDRSPSPCRL